MQMPISGVHVCCTPEIGHFRNAITLSDVTWFTIWCPKDIWFSARNTYSQNHINKIYFRRKHTTECKMLPLTEYIVFYCCWVMFTFQLAIAVATVPSIIKGLANVIRNSWDLIGYHISRVKIITIYVMLSARNRISIQRSWILLYERRFDL